MARTAKPGITFYRVDAGHVQHPKIRLLYNEFDSDGYYIWSCLLDYAYKHWGYYFDTNDKERMELFASDYCKKKYTTITEVINGCIRRGLFDKTVFDMFGILTCDMMQETFVIATADRRAKGTAFEMNGDWLLLDFSEEVPANIVIFPGKKGIVPPKNGILPGKNTQIREEENRREKKREENTTAPTGAGEAVAPPVTLQEYEKQEKNKISIVRFIRLHQPQFIDPYRDLWNLFAKEKGYPEVRDITDARKKHLKTRLREKTFDFCAILKKAAESDYELTGKWFTFDWLLKSQANYVKMLEGNYDRKEPLAATPQQQAKQPQVPQTFMQVLSYLYGRWQEGQLNMDLVLPEYYDKLVSNNMLPLGTMNQQQGNTLDEQKQAAIIHFFKLKATENANPS